MSHLHLRWDSPQKSFQRTAALDLEDKNHVKIESYFANLKKQIFHLYIHRRYKT